MRIRTVHIFAAVLFSFQVSCAPLLYRSGWISRAPKEGRRIVRTARRYLGVRYKWGGASPRGFDCSGLVVYVYKKNGILLPRSVKGQYRRGKRIPSRRLRPGDLVFFKTERARLSHVGIYAGGMRFIHAPRTGKRVTYASLKNPYWRRRYRGAVTYLH
jgi:cell wall-associated NlpC family hydrolase